MSPGLQAGKWNRLHKPDSGLRLCSRETQLTQDPDAHVRPQPYHHKEACLLVADYDPLHRPLAAVIRLIASALLSLDSGPMEELPEVRASNATEDPIVLLTRVGNYLCDIPGS